MTEDLPTLEFRPSAILRGVLLGAGALCGLAIVVQFPRAITDISVARLAVFAALLMPGLLALSLVKRSYQLTDSALNVESLGVRRHIVYTSIRAVDERRPEIILRLLQGSIAITFLKLEDRRRLLKGLVDRARLTPVLDELPHGVLARYVPRAQDIDFLPHHARKRPDSGDSSKVVSSE